MEFCLDEWKEGQFVSLTFEGSYYQLKYRGHKKSLTRFAEVSNPNTWRRISQELLRAAKYAIHLSIACLMLLSGTMLE